MDRFWSKVDKTGDCWTWTAYRDQAGYGRINVDGTPVPAHRIAWVLAFGPIPEGMAVCHHCDNPPCVRPDHLFLGTRADNAADMVAKGRSTKGRRTPIPHGTRAGYQQHRRNDEPACQPCKDAEAAYQYLNNRRRRGSAPTAAPNLRANPLAENNNPTSKEDESQ